MNASLGAEVSSLTATDRALLRKKPDMGGAKRRRQLDSLCHIL